MSEVPLKISVITVSYNSENTIEDTIKSVINQRYSNLEYIIIDGGSTDGTLEKINKYRDQIDIMISEPDNGFYDGINKGIKRCTGDVVGLVNADDFYTDSSCVEKIAEAFSKNNNVDCVYGDLVYVEQEDTDKVVRVWKSKEYEDNLFLTGWMPPHPTFYARKSLFDQFGYYDTNFKISADYELMLRFLHKHKINPFYLPHQLIKMRVGGISNNSLKNRILANQEDRLAWKKNGLQPNLFTLIRKPLSKIKQFF